MNDGHCLCNLVFLHGSLIKADFLKKYSFACVAACGHSLVSRDKSGLSLVGRGYSVAVCRLLIVVAYVCGGQALGPRASVVVAHRLSNCDSWALEGTGFNSCSVCAP